MKVKSFRLRIAVLSALLAGAALVGFGAVAWWLIYDAKVSRLDARLDNQLLQALRPLWRNRWADYEATLSRELGGGQDRLVMLLVRRPDGSKIYQSPHWGTELDNLAPPLTRTGAGAALTTNEPAFYGPAPLPAERWTRQRRSDRLLHLPITRRVDQQSWRVGQLRLPQAEVAIAVSLQAIDQEMALIRHIFLIAIPGGFVLVAAGAWLLAGSALKPVRQLSCTLNQVTVRGLDQRLEIDQADPEFIQLIQGFNRMLQRLERSFKQASRFSGDAAHELKTPLAILQGELERTLQQVEAGSEVQQRLGNLLAEVSRLSSIVRKLLLLSLADAGQMSLYRETLDLSALLRDLLDDFDLLAPRLSLTVEIASGLAVQGDQELLMQIFHNLLSNAIKYNLPDGWVHLQANRQGDQARVSLINASQPLSSQEQQLIFQRFHRGNPNHTQNIDGVGLGLSLSREIAQAHGGRLVLAPGPPGQTTLVLTLPLAEDTASPLADGTTHSSPPHTASRADSLPLPGTVS
jgi:two-component system heavy metal sensor histidine kinase CusS